MIHLHLQECQSTQQEMIQRQDSLQKEEFLITTERQLSGRGQRGKAWKFYPGSLAFSFTMPASLAIELSSMEIGVLFCQYVQEDVQLKWPNDLIWGKKKCGGILCQLVGKTIVAGVGINIAKEDIASDPSFSFPTGAFPWQGGQLQKEWPLGFYQFVLKNRLEEGVIRDLFIKYCAHLNRPVMAMGQNIQGIFSGVGKHGEALIDVGDERHKIITGPLLYD